MASVRGGGGAWQVRTRIWEAWPRARRRRRHSSPHTRHTESVDAGAPRRARFAARLAAWQSARPAVSSAASLRIRLHHTHAASRGALCSAIPESLLRTGERRRSACAAPAGGWALPHEESPLRPLFLLGLAHVHTFHLHRIAGEHAAIDGSSIATRSRFSGLTRADGAPPAAVA